MCHADCTHIRMINLDIPLWWWWWWWWFRWAFTLFLQATKALTVSRVIVLLFLGPRHSRWDGEVSPTPRPPLPLERSGTHFTGGWVGLRAGLDWWKISPSTGIRSRTVQPVVSRYTDWATRPTDDMMMMIMMIITIIITIIIIITILSAFRKQEPVGWGKRAFKEFWRNIFISASWYVQ